MRPPPRAPPGARLAAARERIVSAALTQLAEGGYASASVAAVARRAGVATGTVYRHFPSKQGLFAEGFRRAAQREVGALAEALVGPLQRRDAGADALVDALQAFVLRSVGVSRAHA